MAIEGMSAARAAMIQALSGNRTYVADTETQNLFSNLLCNQLLSGLGAESQTGTDGLFSGSDLTNLMLLSMLSGGSSLAAQSLGAALFGSSNVSATLGSPYRSALAAYGVSTFGQAITPTSASKPTTPAIISTENRRSAALYRQVINQFSVETNPRYAVNKKGTGDTYCNIFVWDVTSAMGAEIPYYVNPETGAPMRYPNVDGAMYMNANRMYDWLGEHGSKYGWHQVSAEQAQMLANQGRPVVTALKRNGAHGHVQIVCPSNDGRYDAGRGVTVAQAGSRLSNYTSTSAIYKKSSLSKVVYYAHA